MASLPRSRTSQAQPLPKWPGLLLELREQSLGAAEGLVDQLGEPPHRPLAGGRRETLPEEAVVPVLGGAVEQRLVALFFRGADQVDERSARRGALPDQRVDLVDIGAMVLAVVKIERLGRHVGA